MPKIPGGRIRKDIRKQDRKVRPGMEATPKTTHSNGPAAEGRAVQVAHVSVSYGRNTVVDDVSFSLPQGVLAAIIGPNGAGKSSLLKAMLGLVHMDRGSVTVFGQPFNAVRKRIAYMPQRSDVDWTFPITVLEVAVLGTYPSLPLFRRPGRAEYGLARECLARVGMERYADRHISELSGGQQQRVFIARALAQKPELFLLDEPFAGIDAASADAIMTVLRQEVAAGRTVIAVHHDLAEVRTQITHAVLLNRQLIADGRIEEVFRPEIIGDAYEANLQLFRELGAVSA